MAQSALLVMDVQNGIVSRIDGDALLPVVARAIDAARAAELPVIYVRAAFRPGFPELSPSNQAFAAIASAGAASGFTVDDEATQVCAAVAPHDGDVVVIKKRFSAFAGSDLDVVLRSLQVDSLVLTGVSTSGVVLSTVRAASDLDFGLAVLSDACADADPEVHRVLLEKVFPRQSAVLTTDEWARGL